jgi:hypothetical protein
LSELLKREVARKRGIPRRLGQSFEGSQIMTKTITTLAAAGALAVALTAAPTDANAYCRGCAVGAGILGGLAAGAIIGGAIAAGPPVYYGPGPYYAAPPPPACYWARGEPVWNGYRWVRPRVQVCN